MKILVTGATGQLGYEVCKVLREREVEYKGVCSADFSIVDAAAVDAYVREYRPDAVIHCAAYTAVDLSLIHILKRRSVKETPPCRSKSCTAT